MRFVIVVDMQRDFVSPDGALPVPGANALVEPTNRFLASLTPADTAGVLFTFDTHDAATYPGSPEAAQFPPHCYRGTDGWHLVVDPSVIDPAIPVFRLEKNVFAMWEEDHLHVARHDAPDERQHREHFFAALEVDEVVVVGVAADYCVRWAIDGLVERGFRVHVPAELTAGIARPIHAVVAEHFAGHPVRATAPAPV